MSRALWIQQQRNQIASSRKSWLERPNTAPIARDSNSEIKISSQVHEKSNSTLNQRKKNVAQSVGSKQPPPWPREIQIKLQKNNKQTHLNGHLKRIEREGGPFWCRIR